MVFHVFTAMLCTVFIKVVKKDLNPSHNAFIPLTNPVTIVVTAVLSAFHTVEAVVDKKFQIASSPAFSSSQAFLINATVTPTIAVITNLIPSQTI